MCIPPPPGSGPREPQKISGLPRPIDVDGIRKWVGASLPARVSQCGHRRQRSQEITTGGAMSLRITVVGCGYLGATHAACMAELGFEVLGLDVDERKVAVLNEGRTPFFEPGLEPLLRKHVDTGRLRFTTSYEEVAAFGDVHFLCVSTPQRHGDYAADLSHVESAVRRLAPLLERPCLVIGKSTVPVGTAARIRQLLSELAPLGAGV